MSDSQERPWVLRHARRLSDGRVVITAHDAAKRVVHAVLYDEPMKRVLDEVHGPAADEMYGRACTRKT